MTFELKSALLASLFLVVFISTEVLCSTAPTDCDHESLMKCKRLVFNYTTNEEEIQAMCSVLHDELRCIDNFTRKCLEPDRRAVFNNIYAGSSMTLQEICQPGPFRDRYLRHSPCMKTIANQLSRCENEFNSNLKAAHASSQEKNLSVHVCGSLTDFLSCSKTIVRSNCGEETATFSAGLLEKMSMALMEVLACAQQDFLEATSSASSLSPVTTLLFFVIFYEFYKHVR